MKYICIAALVLLVLVVVPVEMGSAAQVNGVVGPCMIRGQVTNVGITQLTWDNVTFPGFYYDIDKNLGAETLTFRLSLATPTGATLSDQPNADGYRGVIYETKAQLKTFKYKPWGQYDVIGFLANKYFAAYDPTVTPDVANVNEFVAFLYDASKNRNIMTNEQISKVLMDDNKEQTITSANPLKLAEGYQLAIKSIDVDRNRAYIELTKNGKVVDDKVVQPSIANARMKDQTYYYKTALGDTTDIIQIAVHFKNAFAGSDTNIATVDGEFQISDTVTPLKPEQQYDKMSIRNVDATNMAVTMDNKDNQITLSKNKDVSLMQDIHIRTADQDGTVDAPLRYYIYKNITAPGPYQLRGTVTNVGQNQVTWDNSSFSGFYYDIDKNLGAETLTFRLSLATPTGATLSDQPNADGYRGVIYETKAQPTSFAFKPWGYYYNMSFLGQSHFAGYIEGSGFEDGILWHKSKDLNLLANSQLGKVLVDNGEPHMIKSGASLKLNEGFEARLYVDDSCNKTLLELYRNGNLTDRDYFAAPHTYVYAKDVGNSRNISILALHVSGVNCTEGKTCIVDGVFQISDTVTPINSEQQYDKMSIRNVDAIGMIITMDNKDNQITLSKNRDIPLMGNIHIRTADQDGTVDAPLRYYIYTEGS